MSKERAFIHRILLKKIVSLFLICFSICCWAFNSGVVLCPVVGVYLLERCRETERNTKWFWKDNRFGNMTCEES